MAAAETPHINQCPVSVKFVIPVPGPAVLMMKMDSKRPQPHDFPPSTAQQYVRKKMVSRIIKLVHSLDVRLRRLSSPTGS